jgi:hypothetical protein
MVRRIEVGPLLAALASIVLLVSLFLRWFDTGATAWEVFEIVDLLLAAAAVACLLAAVSALGAPGPAIDPRVLAWSSLVALVLVVQALLDHPPAARELDPDLGLWLALVAAVLMAVGALLALARVRISLDVQARRTRVPAVDARPADEEPPR